MTVSWSELAIAVSLRIEWERLCGRERLIDESFLVRVCAEYLQAAASEPVYPEHQHPVLEGARVDLVGIPAGRQQLSFALEAKWIPREGGVRHWPREVALEVFRLQHISRDVRVDADRILVVGGCSFRLRQALFDRRIRADGELRAIFPELLPDTPQSAMRKYQVRNCEAWLQAFFRDCAGALKAKLPSTYDARLAGHHRASQEGAAAEVFVWLTKRPTGWGSFDRSTAWRS